MHLESRFRKILHVHNLENQIAFDIYKANHPNATISAKGNYPEWEGLDSQRILKEDMALTKHK